MADWLILFLKYGGFGAVLLLVLFVMGKWLLKRITAALDSYTTAYLQQKAAIDARIASLEKLVEEQARLTRTVESIKDEIAAQAKSRDNRWEFQKDVYVNLITDTTGLIRLYANIKHLDANARVEALEPFRTATDTLMTHLCLARLAMADEALVALDKTTKDLFTAAEPSSLSDTEFQQKINAYIDLRNLLCVAGRN